MKKVITIHQTDLFRPHNDPDDHYDLVCQFALAKMGYIDLRVVLMDYPHDEKYHPDIIAIKQLNHITNLHVQTAFGGKKGERNSSLITTLRDILLNAEEKVVIHIVGSCYDMAKFYQLYPQLFIDKVEALYINAGSAYYTNIIEYNQYQNNDAYLLLFSIPVNIYWLPCFHDMDRIWEIDENGSFFKFKQIDVFQNLNQPLLNYFISCLRKDPITSNYQSLLDKPIDEKEVTYYGNLYRNMWCTAGFIDAIGLSVDLEGKISKNVNEPLFKFKDIHVSIQRGQLNWTYSKEKSNIKIIKIQNTSLYQDQMTNALNTIISWLKY